MKRYFGGFEDWSSMLREFEVLGSKWEEPDPYDPTRLNVLVRSVITKEYPLDHDVLLACYDCGNYEGQAYVLFRQDDKLFEVRASHCSCNGLEGSWAPEETSLEALRMRNYHEVLDNEAHALWKWLLDRDPVRIDVDSCLQ